MATRDPFKVVKRRYVTEKTNMLQELKNSESNPSVRRCKAPKYVFIVDEKASKREIAESVEAIYAEKNIKVVKVNTIHIPAKTRRVRGRIGNKSGFKKAIVTLEENDTIETI